MEFLSPSLSQLHLGREIKNLVPHELKKIINSQDYEFHSNHILGCCTGLDTHCGEV